MYPDTTVVQLYYQDSSSYSCTLTTAAIDRKFMKVRFENIDRHTPANLAIQVRTLPHEFGGLYFQIAPSNIRRSPYLLRCGLKI